MQRTKHSFNNSGEYTHKYTGPTTKWGMSTDDEVKIVGSRAGGKLVRKQGSTIVFVVHPKHLEKL